VLPTITCAHTTPLIWTVGRASALTVAGCVIDGDGQLLASADGACRASSPARATELATSAATVRRVRRAVVRVTAGMSSFDTGAMGGSALFRSGAVAPGGSRSASAGRRDDATHRVDTRPGENHQDLTIIGCDDHTVRDDDHSSGDSPAGLA
jgi:hypothetical protein